ncbi:substrate-binding periplasmic protein [Chitinibacteraceae bacterium HSL-7]
MGARVWLSLLLVSGCAQAGDTKVRLCAEDSWPPLSSVVRGEAAGAVVDLVRLALSAHGRQVEFAVRSYSACLELTRAGHYDGMIDVAHSPERDPQFEWTHEPLLVMDLHLVGRASLSPDNVDYSAVRHRRVGLTKGYEYPKALLGQPGMIAVENVSELGNLRQLAAGRLDYMLLSTGTLASYMGQLTPLERQQIRDFGVVDQLPLFLVLHKGGAASRRLAQEFDAGMQRAAHSGQARAVFEHWQAVP